MATRFRSSAMPAAVDVRRLIRSVEQKTGCEIILSDDPGTGRLTISTRDPQLPGVSHKIELHPPSKIKWLVSQFHEAIYKSRCMEVFRRQGWRCVNCSEMKPLQGHHKKHRGAHGRDDRIENLEGRCAKCHSIEHGG